MIENRIQECGACGAQIRYSPDRHWEWTACPSCATKICLDGPFEASFDAQRNLQILRRSSAYPRLRFVFNWSRYIIHAVNVLVLIALAVTAYNADAWAAKSDPNAIRTGLAIGAVVIYACGIFLAEVLHEACNLVLDIADGVNRLAAPPRSVPFTVDPCQPISK